MNIIEAAQRLPGSLRGIRRPEPAWSSDPRADNWHLPLESDPYGHIMLHQGARWIYPNITVDDLLATDWEIAE